MIFLYFYELSFTSYGKGKKKGIKSRLTQLYERLGELMQYTSEANLSESVWLDRALRFACTLPKPYGQAAILNLLIPYIRSCYCTL